MGLKTTMATTTLPPSQGSLAKRSCDVTEDRPQDLSQAGQLREGQRSTAEGHRSVPPPLEPLTDNLASSDGQYNLVDYNNNNPGYPTANQRCNDTIGYSDYGAAPRSVAPHGSAPRYHSNTVSANQSAGNVQVPSNQQQQYGNQYEARIGVSHSDSETAGKFSSVHAQNLHSNQHNPQHNNQHSNQFSNQPGFELTSDSYRKAWLNQNAAPCTSSNIANSYQTITSRLSNGPSNGHSNNPSNGHSNNPSNGYSNGPSNSHNNNPSNGHNNNHSNGPSNNSSNSYSNGLGNNSQVPSDFQQNTLGAERYNGVPRVNGCYPRRGYHHSNQDSNAHHFQPNTSAGHYTNNFVPSKLATPSNYYSNVPVPQQNPSNLAVLSNFQTIDLTRSPQPNPRMASSVQPAVTGIKEEKFDPELDTPAPPTSSTTTTATTQQNEAMTQLATAMIMKGMLNGDSSSSVSSPATTTNNNNNATMRRRKNTTPLLVVPHFQNNQTTFCGKSSPPETACSGGEDEDEDGASSNGGGSNGGGSGVLDLSGRSVVVPSDAAAIAAALAGSGGDDDDDEYDAENNKLGAMDLNRTFNQHGRAYSNGRPLPTEIRANIILLHKLDIRPCEISRRLKISHGVVSKIIKQFREKGSILPGNIGGSKPKVTTPMVKSMVQVYKSHNPNIFAWEIRRRLIEDGICSEKNVPSISSINRIIRDKRGGASYHNYNNNGQEVSMDSSGEDPDKPLVAQDMLREMASLATLQQQQHYQQQEKEDSKSQSQLQTLLSHSDSPNFANSQGKERLTLPITILPSVAPLVVAPNIGESSQGQEEVTPVVSTQQEDTGAGVRKPRKGTPMKIPDSSSVNHRSDTSSASPDDVVVLGEDAFFTETEMMGGAEGGGARGVGAGVGAESKPISIPSIRASRTPILPRSQQQRNTEILDLSAKKSEENPKEKPIESGEPQILLLNGKEYEIVSLGNGRWISRNEYELMHALGTVVDKGMKDGKSAASPDSTQQDSQKSLAGAVMKRKRSQSVEPEEPPVKQSTEETETALDLSSKPTSPKNTVKNSPHTEEKSVPMNLSAKGKEFKDETIDKVKELAEAVAEGDMAVRQALLQELLKSQITAKLSTATSSTSSSSAVNDSGSS